MIMTFMMLINTMAISMILMKNVIRSIMRAMLKKGESFSQVWSSKMGFPCWFSAWESRPSSFSLNLWSFPKSFSRMANSLISGPSILRSSLASSMWM